MQQGPRRRKDGQMKKEKRVQQKHHTEKTDGAERNVRKRRSPELLAPAGSMEAFRGALNAGADAVYLAGQRFGARAYAANFSEEELTEVIARAHLFGVRIYLTVNTLTRQSELPELVSFVERLAGQGLDGVIVQDFGVAAAIRKRCPLVELHASTQMSVTGPEGVRFLKRQGFVRVVPARELSLEEIRLLKQEDIEVETFIHGAMCYSYSGRCLMSSFLGGRSGNRGRCAGTCRLPYEILDENGNQAGRDGQCYPISMKDMCALPILPELIDCGIDSFKIEGRMKKPEYVAGTVAIYRKYLDRFQEWNRRGRPGKWTVDREDLELLHHLYIRSDLCCGYYGEQNGRDMVTIHEPGYRGASEETLKEIRRKYLVQDKKLPVTAQAGFYAGQSSWMRVVAKGAEFTAEGAPVQEARSRALSEEDIRAKLSRSGDVPFALKELEVYTDGSAFLPVSSLGELRRTALRGLWQELLRKPEKNAEAAEPGRQRAMESVCSSGQDCRAVQKENSVKETTEAGRLPQREYYLVRSAAQASEVLCWISAGFRNPADIETEKKRAEEFHENHEDSQKAALILDGEALERPERILERAAAAKCPVYAAFPYILRGRDRGWLSEFYENQKENFYGFVTRNLEELEFLCEKEYDKTVLADSMLYAWNRESGQILRSFCHGMVLSQELDRHEMAQTFADSLTDKILMVYGRVPLMLTANCVRRTQGSCRKGRDLSGKEDGDFWYLRDRTKTDFPVCAQCSHCQNIIYNSVPTSLHGYGQDALMQNAGAVLLSFTTEDADEVRNTLRLFSQNGILKHAAERAAEGKHSVSAEGRAAARPFDFTTGHYRKGAI